MIVRGIFIKSYTIIKCLTNDGLAVTNLCTRVKNVKVITVLNLDI